MTKKRTKAPTLAQLLADSPRPVYAVDGDQRIVYCNAACAAWLNIEADVLLGAVCRYHDAAAAAGAEALAADLCPPPEACAGRPFSAVVECRRWQTTPSRRRIDFFPLGADPGDAAGVLALVAEHEATDADDLPTDELPPVAWRQRLRALRLDMAPRGQPDALVGRSPPIRRAARQWELARAAQVHLQVVGPPGARREQVARAAHLAGRDPPPIVAPVACPIVDAELMQAAVTTVLRRAADAGLPQPALLLLDADLLPAAAQQELAGFLALPGFAARLLATTSQPLAALAAQGVYSPELAAALSTLVIELPPLAARRDDLPLLAQRLLEAGNAAGEPVRGGFTPAALDLLDAYPWPDDLDELAEAIASARRQAGGPLIDAADLPAAWRLAASAPPPRPTAQPQPLDHTLAEFERELVAQALAAAKRNKTKAAQLLGVSRPRLLRLIALHRLAE